MVPSFFYALSNRKSAGSGTGSWYSRASNEQSGRWPNLLLCLALVAGLIFTGFVVVRASESVTAGYRDFYFGPNGPSSPTGEKPESKLWWNDGFWWGSLWDPVSEDYHIFRLDLATQSWLDTGTVLDTRLSRADTLWDGQHLYVVSHSFTTNGQPSASWGWGRLFRYSYNQAAKSYSLDSGFPVDVTRGRSETLVIARDSTGQLWVTYIESGNVMVNRSLDNDLVWGEPFILPANAAAVSVTTDDISSLVAFQGDKIGLMWSNQITSKMYFAVHLDGSPDNVWQAEETALPGPNCTVSCADDHVNLKSLQSDGSGRVFAAVKTSLTQANAPLIMLLVRGLNGNWDSAVFGRVSDQHTRPIVLVDEEHGRIYMFATINESGGAIYVKESDINNISFPLGPGEPFILSAVDTHINNATSTKQNLNGATGLVVLASDSSTDYYFHNYLDLNGGTPPPPPAIDYFTPTSGQQGSSVTILGSGFTGATAVKINNTAAAFTVVSAGEIQATVPATTSGPISVTTPYGSTESSQFFSVTAPPVISSFNPTSGQVGTPVTIFGQNFSNVTSVEFNGVPATFTVISDTEIHAIVPEGATTGPIIVQTPYGESESELFTVLPAPSYPLIDSFNPTSGSYGDLVTIYGANFTGATDVSFNGIPASFTVVSDGQVDTVVPEFAASGPIYITNSAGATGSKTSFTVIVDSPVNWVSIDIGTSHVGATDVNGTAVTITGSGAGIRGTNDSFRYVYDTSTGDLEFWAKVTAWDSSGERLARAGLMIRSSTAADAAQMNVALTGSKGIRVQWRPANGDRLTEVNGPHSFTIPVWLKFKKTGSSISAYYSTDGATWVQIGSAQTVSLGNNYLYGMAVTASHEGAFAQAAFDPVVTSK